MSFTPTLPPGATTAADVTATSIPSSQSTPSAAQRLVDTQVGYSLEYPAGWQPQGQVLATEFASGALCQSVEIVDYRPPADSGPGSRVLHSFVQVCAQTLGDGLTLDVFMQQTYGQALGSFEQIELAGLPAYENANDPLGKIVFLQTESYRIQIATAVVASSELQAERLDQIEEILGSFSIPPG